jgi:hypothetical protein
LVFVHWRPVSNLPDSNTAFNVGQQIGTRFRGIGSAAATVAPIPVTISPTPIQNAASLDRIKEELFALECETLAPEEYAEAHAALETRLKNALETSTSTSRASVP